jgi:hypothetical protein
MPNTVDKDRVNWKAPPGPFYCMECKEEFSVWNLFCDHMKSKHGIDNFPRELS